MDRKRQLGMPKHDRRAMEAHVYEQTIGNNMQTNVLDIIVPMLTDKQLFQLYETMVFDLNCELTTNSESFPDYLYWEYDHELAA